MTLSLTAVYSILRGRTEQGLNKIGVDTSTMESLALVFDPVIATCLHQLDYVPSDYLILVEADVTQVDNEDIHDLLDLCEFRILGNIINRMDEVDERLGPHGRWSSQYPERLRRHYAELRKSLNMRLGLDVGSITTGTLELKVFDESS